MVSIKELWGGYTIEGRQTDIQTDRTIRQTDRQTDRQTEQSDRQTDRQTEQSDPDFSQLLKLNRVK